MSRIRLTVATAGVLALGTVFATPSHAAVKRSCREDDRFIQQVRTVDLSCKVGLEIAFKWARSAACFRGEGDLIADRATPCTVRTFRCTPRAAEGGVTVTCKRRTRSVRFFDSGG